MGVVRGSSRRFPILELVVFALLATMIVRVPEAPATVAEQRARLPPPAECESEVEGRWRALIFSENHESWYEFTLEIHEDPKDKSTLSGLILVDTWTGTSAVSEPGPCVGRRFRGKMIGSGRVVNGDILFGGDEFEITELMCGEPTHYNSDNFSGRIDPQRQEFQSVNNDGGDAVNEATVFRRIACFDEGVKKPAPDLVRPPFYPKRRSGGGC